MTGIKDSSGEHPPINLDQYVPAYLTWIANKLSRGASQHYLRLFGVGIEAWRCMVLLATEGAASAQLISRVTGMDKSSVSRCLKSMQDAKLVKTALDPHDGRARLASLTAKGQAMHDEIRAIALERERSLLSVLSKTEQAELLRLLRLVHENLPAVEEDTSAFIDKKYADRPPGGKRPSERPG